MPISHKYKLIFIHIPKCAGISMWRALDLTISPADLISVTPPILQHLLPEQLKKGYIDEKTWDSYKKFTIVRNPYDRVISDYFWMKDDEEAALLTTDNFDDFLSLREDVVLNNKYHENKHFDHFYPMYFYFEGIHYDHVLRFENLEEDYNALRSLYNIENPLTKNNQSSRDNVFELTNEQKERIYKLYKKDFVQFGYTKKDFKTKKKLAVAQQKEDESVLHGESKGISASFFFNGNEYNGFSKEHVDVSIGSSPSLNATTPKTTKIQIFWAKEDLQFTEENSQSVQFGQEQSNHNLVFGINSTSDIQYLRLDLGDQPGFLIINDIKIESENEQVLWDWTSGVVQQKNDIVFIKRSDCLDGKSIQLSLNNDPWFLINIGGSEHPREKLKVILNLSTLPEEQHNFLNKYDTALLSLGVTGNNQQANIQIGEFKNVSEVISALYINLTELEKERNIAKTANEINDQRILDLMKDKEMLSHELSAKNQLLIDIAAEKNGLNQKNESLTVQQLQSKENQEQLEKARLQLENELKHYQQIYSELLEKTETQFAQLNQDKVTLTSELTFKEGLINRLNEEKNGWEEKHIQNSTSLNDALNEKRNLLEQLNTKEFELQKFSIEEKNLKTDLVNLKSLQEQNDIKKEQLERQIGTIQKQVDEFLIERKTLSLVLEEKEKTINALLSENRVLLESNRNIQTQLQLVHTELDEVKQRLVKKESENEKLKEEIAELGKSINAYIKKYDDKNIFQIAINRIVSKGK